MKWPSPYLKMRVLGAVENAQGKTLTERIKNTAKLSFSDEEGNLRSFTWRTIFTWYYRYKNHGVTGVSLRNRSDKGATRKISPEELLEAINQVLPFFVNMNESACRISVTIRCVVRFYCEILAEISF